LEDAFILWECVVVPKVHEYLAAEEAQKRRGKK